MSLPANPCRRTAFEAFGLDKNETSIKNIRRATTQARASWKDNGGKLTAGDGSEWELSEAALNSLEKQILDPLERLRLEQFVHEEHWFATGDELAQLLADVEQAAGQDHAWLQLLDQLDTALLQRVVRFLPELERPAIEDDLPWPDPPEAAAVELEPFEVTILREK